MSVLDDFSEMRFTLRESLEETIPDFFLDEQPSLNGLESTLVIADLFSTTTVMEGRRDIEKFLSDPSTFKNKFKKILDTSDSSELGSVEIDFKKIDAAMGHFIRQHKTTTRGFGVFGAVAGIVWAIWGIGSMLPLLPALMSFANELKHTGTKDMFKTVFEAVNTRDEIIKRIFSVQDEKEKVKSLTASIKELDRLTTIIKTGGDKIEKKLLKHGLISKVTSKKDHRSLRRLGFRHDEEKLIRQFVADAKAGTLSSLV